MLGVGLVPMTHATRQLGSLLLGCIAFAMPGPLAAQERAMVPLTIDGEQVRLATITYKPPGNGPFPTLIFHHGSTGRGRDPALFERPYDPKALAGWFTARGWAVILASRRGRGGSEGTYDEGFETIATSRGLGRTSLEASRTMIAPDPARANAESQLVPAADPAELLIQAFSVVDVIVLVPASEVQDAFSHAHVRELASGNTGEVR